MITRRHEIDGCHSRAVYSDCETYRYELTRRWGDGGTCLWIMLNPSTATELKNDPTIERCERRTCAMGFGAMTIANLFAFRATKPADLALATDPVGPGNDDVLKHLSDISDLTICGWGVHGTLHHRQRTIPNSLSGPLHALGTTKAGQPRHPLYVAYSVSPSPWSSPTPSTP